MRRILLIVALAASIPGSAKQSLQEWPVYAADAGATHFSPLTDITPANVASLDVAWEWKTGEENLAQFGTRPGNFQATPLMIDNVLYFSTPYNRVVALNAETGAEIWTFDPKAYELGQPPNGTGLVHRGVAAWRDGAKVRIFINSRAKLIALDALTGKPVETFGERGTVDLTRGLRWSVDPARYTNTSPPVIYKDLVILGNGVGDRMVYKQDPPGDVRAFDARTGRQVWRFNTVPDAGEKGVETWENDSWKITGHTNVWAPFSVDVARGLVYLPVTTPSNDFFGGRRPGANLYGESLVCLDANTGARKWHFQIAHHGLWDYDPPSAPILATITVAGRRIDAVVQLTKQGFVFVFDRVTGKPVWPIEERAVSQSDVAGEKSWPTQPFPSKPAAITPQGVSLDDALDFTPALKAAAQAEMKKYRIGPLYTPPSVEGTIMRPGIIGGANWGGGAFDPATGMLYVKTSHQAAVAKIRPADRSPNNPRASEVDADFVGDLGTGADFAPPAPVGAPAGGRGGGGRLPMFKPPYGELVAINLNTGAIAWRMPQGDSPNIRNHPALAGVTLPERLGVAGAPGSIVTKSGLVFVGGADMALSAYDAKTGKELLRKELARRANGTPMTYRTSAGHQFLVIATGAGANAALVAMRMR
ncbi:MAG: pyrroloquinoline quinone-dependent dehydrogenase [Acidobacteria bacterium]|nr:MAG: pyrroloquinoline quinone-dependent dehydrogenase [Acidobacteriota bacterium]